MSAADCARAVALLGVGLALGCAGPGYRFEDLPDSPVAFVYRTMAESDEVFDQVLEREKLLTMRRTGRVPPASRSERNRIDAEAVAALFGIGTAADRAAATLGRLAFLDPRTGEVTPVGWARRGARPVAWSPDRTRLLYITLRRGDPHVFEYDRRTDASRSITHDRRRYLDAAYCGERAIVFSAVDPSGKIRLYLRTEGEGPPRPLGENALAYAPVCTPDGEVVLFETRDPQGREWIHRLDLGDKAPVETRLTRGRHPSVTPDGEWVVYSAWVREGWKLWRMRPDGSGRHPLGASSGWELDPSVSPDGRYVVFSVRRGKRPVRPQLFVRSLEGGEDRPLRVQGDGLQPVW